MRTAGRRNYRARRNRKFHRTVDIDFDRAAHARVADVQIGHPAAVRRAELSPLMQMRCPMMLQAVAVMSLAAFLTVIPFRDFDGIIGDNIAQVGYWRILADHSLVHP